MRDPPLATVLGSRPHLAAAANMRCSASTRTSSGSVW